MVENCYLTAYIALTSNHPTLTHPTGNLSYWELIPLLLIYKVDDFDMLVVSRLKGCHWSWSRELHQHDVAGAVWVENAPVYDQVPTLELNCQCWTNATSSLVSFCTPSLGLQPDWDWLRKVRDNNILLRSATESSSGWTIFSILEIALALMRSSQGTVMVLDRVALDKMDPCESDSCEDIKMLQTVAHVHGGRRM